jgi:hypothetical protein
MKSKPINWLFILTVIFLTSCVAKKEYLTVEAARKKAEQQVWDLSNANNSKAQRIQELMADYEKLKKESQESNAANDQWKTNMVRLQDELIMLRKQTAEKDAEIKRLNNEITLQKKQSKR